MAHGIDLNLGKSTLGVTWRQEVLTFRLDLRRSSVTEGLHGYDAEDGALEEPQWRAVLGHELVASTTRGNVMQLLFAPKARSTGLDIYLAAASCMEIDGQVALIDSDEVLVGFGSDNPLGALFSSAL